MTFGLFLMLAVECRQAPAGQWIPDPDAAVNVYFFHLTDRCDACNAIETNTMIVLEENFKSRMENGSVKFQSFNIDKKENKAVTEKYKISYTSLLLVRSDGEITDFTASALNYANLDPERFQTLLKAEIDKNLE